MRRLLTWGLVAAVAALGLAAGIDALRGGDEPKPVAATEPGPSDGADAAVAEARAALQAAGVPRGRLVYADGDCRNHTLELPDLVASPAGYEASAATARSWAGWSRPPGP